MGKIYRRIDMALEVKKYLANALVLFGLMFFIAGMINTVAYGGELIILVVSCLPFATGIFIYKFNLKKKDLK